MFDFITIGDCTWDTFLQIDSATVHYKKGSHRPEWLSLHYADKICIDNMAQSVGGNAGNVSVGLSRLNYKGAIVTELGDDQHGKLILEDLKKSGVNTSLTHIHANKQTRYSLVLSYQGERTILCYHAKRSYSLPKLPQTNWIYYTSLGPSFEKVQNKLIDYLKKNKHVRLACNPGSYQVKEKIEEIKKVLPWVDLLFVNKEEAEKIVGKPGKIPSLQKGLHSLGVKIAVITDGTKGSFVSNGEKLFSMGIYNTPVISKTGAGDAYASAFLAAFMKGKSLEDCMIWGTANAASVTGHLGAHTGLLTESQIKKFIKNHSLT